MLVYVYSYNQKSKMCFLHLSIVLNLLFFLSCRKEELYGRHYRDREKNRNAWPDWPHRKSLGWRAMEVPRGEGLWGRAMATTCLSTTHLLAWATDSLTQRPLGGRCTPLPRTELSPTRPPLITLCTWIKVLRITMCRHYSHTCTCIKWASYCCIKQMFVHSHG